MVANREANYSQLLAGWWDGCTHPLVRPQWATRQSFRLRRVVVQEQAVQAVLDPAEELGELEVQRYVEPVLVLVEEAVPEGRRQPGEHVETAENRKDERDQVDAAVVHDSSLPHVSVRPQPVACHFLSCVVRRNGGHQNRHIGQLDLRHEFERHVHNDVPLRANLDCSKGGKGRTRAMQKQQQGDGRGVVGWRCRGQWRLKGDRAQAGGLW